MPTIGAHRSVTQTGHSFSRGAVIALLAVVLSPMTARAGHVGVARNAPTVTNPGNRTNAESAVSLALAATDHEEDAIITVTARDAANNTATDTLTATDSTTAPPPGAASLVAPTGTTSTATPSFSWKAVSGATHYQLWVNDASTGAKITTTYPAAAVGCGAGTGTCTVSPGVTLAPGAATWWILTSNAAGPAGGAQV